MCPQCWWLTRRCLLGQPQLHNLQRQRQQLHPLIDPHRSSGGLAHQPLPLPVAASDRINFDSDRWRACSAGPSLSFQVLPDLAFYPALQMQRPFFGACSGDNLGAMFFTPDGAFQDEEVGLLPKLYKPVGANQYTAAAMLTLEPPNYSTKVRTISTFVMSSWNLDFEGMRATRLQKFIHFNLLQKVIGAI